MSLAGGDMKPVFAITGKVSMLALRADDLRTEVKDAIAATRQLGFAGVELPAYGREVDPESLSESGRRHLERLVRNQGLRFVSLALDATGRGLADAGQLDAEIGRAAAALRLAADMHVPVVSHDAGSLLGATAADIAAVAEALRAIGEQAERFGSRYALRFRAADADQLVALLDSVACRQIGAGIDPGALVAVGFDPIEALSILGERTIVGYVRDAMAGSTARPGYETALGAGGLDLGRYLAEVSDVVQPGLPILRRSRCADPRRDIAADKSYIGARMAR